MGGFRGMGRWAGAVLWALALAPVPALVAAAVLDRGPGGEVRPTLFPAALTALDPFTWDCARNSLVMAAAVTLAARVVGVHLARLVARGRFHGRRALSVLACAGLGVPPAFGALGLRGAFGAPETWADSVVLDRLAPWAGWVAWFWVALAAGAPVVGLATASALARVGPAQADAARLAGAGRRQVWRRVVWPAVRPDVGRALGIVFTLTLFDPGAPLLLGLRRTLGFQVVESVYVGGEGRLSRAAVLALAAALLAALARVLIGWWGGAAAPAAEPDGPRERRERSGPLRETVSVALLLAVAAVAVWVPVAGVVSVAFAPGAIDSTRHARWAWTAATFATALRDPLTRGYLVNSAAVGVAAVVLDLILARALAGWASVSRGGRWVGRVAAWPEAFPPLAVGVGVLALPVVLRMAADGLRGQETLRPLAASLGVAADVFDVERTPWGALALGVALVHVPLLARSAVARRRALRPVWVDAAVGLGANRRQARRTLSGRWLGAAPSAALLTLTLAATNVTPALILSPTATTRPVGPAVLTLAGEPGDGVRRAAALAALAIAANLAALAVAARGLAGQTRPWPGG